MSEWLDKLKDGIDDLEEACESFDTRMDSGELFRYIDRLIEIAERAQALVSTFEVTELLPGEYDDLVDVLSDEWKKVDPEV